MPECHKCIFNGHPTDACINCTGPREPSHHGRVHISLDSGAPDGDGQTYAAIKACTEGILQERSAPIPRTRQTVAAFFLRLLRADLRTLQILRIRIRNPQASMTELALRLGIKPQRLHARMSHIAKNWPELRPLLGLRRARTARPHKDTTDPE